MNLIQQSKHLLLLQIHHTQHAEGNNTMNKSFLLILAAAIVSITPHARADDRLIGEWHGVLNSPVGQITLVLRVNEDDSGTLAGTMESFEQAPGQFIPITVIDVSGNNLSLSIRQFGASFDGVWNDALQRWEGVFSQGIDIPLVFEKGPPPARDTIEGLDGSWDTVVTRNGVDLRIILHIRTGERGTIATLDSVDQGVMGIPASLSREGNAIEFRVPASGVVYRGLLTSPDTMRGQWELPGEQALQVSLTRRDDTAQPKQAERPQHPSSPFPYRTESVFIENKAAGDVTLAGTLTLPEGDGPFAAAILVTGSGPQDRDQTVFGHKPFLVISDHLTRHGVAVLRYDDRGVGESTGDFASATSADFADDTLAVFEYLRSRPEIKPDAIGIIGHSEGGLVGPLAASQDPRIGFVVSLAGPGDELIEVLLAQNRLIGLSQGESMEALDAREPIVRELMTIVARSSSQEDARTNVLDRLNPEALEILRVQPQQRDIIVGYFTQPWMRYLLRYDPAIALSRIRAPVLALNGSLDRQVEPRQNLAGIRAALPNNSDVTTLELEGLNHLFQHSETGGIGEYAEIPETFATEVLDIITDWIISRFGSHE